MAIAAQEGSQAEIQSEDLERKPLLSFRAILLMNFGFFGIQYSFGLQQTAINPIYEFLGADPAQLPLLNLAGPVTGLFIQPLIGAMSDRTWSDRWGRRKPYFLIGAIGCSICLFLWPFVFALWMAFILLWLLDASNNTAMEPYRAFISDKLPESQLARGFLTQSMFVGAGAVTANLSLFVFQRLIDGTTAAGIPFWVFWAFFIGSVCSIGTVLISVLSTKEIPPTEDELAELRSRPSGLRTYISDIAAAVRAMPFGMHKIGFVYLFQWYAIVVYWQFVATSIGESVFNVAPDDPGFEQAAGWVGAMNGTYNFVTIFAALGLIGFAARFGAKWIHAAALGGAAVGMLALSQVGNQYVALLPMILLGIAWASMMGVPYILVASMVPKERLGVYMGIVNMMIVVPMLIQTVTFGWIFEHVLGGLGTHAIIFSGAMFAIGAIAMLFVSPPKETEESPIMPLGAPRRIDNVYNRVVVGSDGTPASLVTVGHAAGVAAAADADLFVVSAYNPQTRPGQATPSVAAGERRELYGEEAAREAILASIKELKRERARNIDHRIVEGTPAHALLDTAGSDPKNLIVVGNRGLGAIEGEALGSVPREVVKNAVCDVMVVQINPEEDQTSSQSDQTSGLDGQTML
jgi:maltose/moltooligosaccharide transporter